MNMSSPSALIGTGWLSLRKGQSMVKQMADASGPMVAVAYFFSQIIPTLQPVLIFIGVVASLVWYGIRFYDRCKYGPDNND